MAKEYYGFVERQAGSQINWAEVSSNVVKTLQDIEAERERKRAELDKMTTDYNELLETAPSGDYQTANSFVHEMSAAASEASLINKRLLRAGILKSKDFKQRMQNLTDGTKDTFEIAELYQSKYKEFLERTKNGDNQDLEAFMMESVEGFGKLNDVGAYIDQNTNAVSLGKMVNEDGVRKMSSNKADYFTTNELKSFVQQQFNKYDLNADLAEEVELLGTYITSIKRLGGDDYTGSITKLLDPTLRKSYDATGKNVVATFENMENNFINSILENPYNASSIMTEDLVKNPKTGVNYKYTWDLDKLPEGANREDYILLTSNGSGRVVPEYTKEQRDAQYKAVQAKFRNMIDREQTIGAVTEPKESSAGRADDADANMVTNLGKLYFGTEGEQQSAMEYVVAQNPKAIRGERTDKAVVLYDADGNEVARTEFKEKDGEIIRTQSDWIQGAAAQLGGVKDVNKAMRNSGLDFEREFSTETSSFELNKKPKEATIQDRYESLVASKTPTSAFQGDEDAVKNALEQQGLDNLGFKISTPTDGKDNIVLVKGNVRSPKIPVGDLTPDEAMLVAKKVREFIQANTTTDELVNFASTGVLPDLVERTPLTGEQPNTKTNTKAPRLPKKKEQQ